MKKIVLLILASWVLQQAQAQLRLPGYFSSGMVLQQHDSVTLWGWANPLEKIAITTSWNNRTDTAITNNLAQWSLTIKTPAAGGPYTISLSGYSKLLLSNVMVGEVWVCSGQSNMEWNYYAGVNDMQAELNLHIQPNIRFLHIPKSTAQYPQQDVRCQWTVCDSNTLKQFSAVGYFFAKKLATNLHVPVGIINSSWGATPAEVWMPADSVNSQPMLQAAAAKLSPNPWSPIAQGVLYNSMIAPITRYPIAGILWYQGEGNTAYPSTYAPMLTVLINSWRSAWKRLLPFYMVQIAPYTYGNNYNAAIIREQQALVTHKAHVGMVVTTDLVDDTTDIHPKNKKEVGFRLANMALAKTYQLPNGQDAYAAFEHMQILGGRAILQFNSKLICKGSKVNALWIAGADKIFYPAEAKLQNNQLTVWSNRVKQPLAVRFGFSNAGVGNLFGANGLPVIPFRTDDWPVE